MPLMSVGMILAIIEDECWREDLAMDAYHSEAIEEDAYAWMDAQEIEQAHCDALDAERMAEAMDYCRKWDMVNRVDF